MRYLPLTAVAALLSLFVAAPAHAGAEALANTRPLIALGVGHFDTFDNVEQDESTSLRFEYRFGNPFWYVLKPQIALELTTDGSAGAFAGIVADWVLNDHWVVAPSFSVGAWASGAGKEMGSTLMFRSQLETGYRFDNDWRLIGALSHMSNGDIGDKNPGEETVALYLQMPAETLLPR